MRDSGVPWLGQVPGHWQRLPGRSCFVEKQTPNAGLQETTVLSLSYGRIVVKPPEKLHGLVPASFETYQIVETDDIIVRPTDLQNDWNSLRFAISRTRGIITSAYMCFRTTRLLAPEFGQLLLHAYDLKKVFYGLGSGLRQNLDWRDFKYLPCLVPSLPEQAAIVRFVGHTDRCIRRYILAKQKLIKLMEEQTRAIVHLYVTRGLDPSVRLKPSGVQWLGDVPDHWEVCRVKQVAQIVRGQFTHRPRNDPSLYDGPYPFIQTGDVARSTKTITSYGQTLNDRGLSVSKMFPAGTLVMTIAANIGEVAVLDFDACFPDSVVGFVPRATVERDYLYYCFVAMKLELLREAPVNTQGNLNVDRIGSRRVPVPPVLEQQETIRHVERTTAGLSRVSEHARIEIDLVRQYRTRLIADVVTGKLDVRAAAARLPEELESSDSPESPELPLADDEEAERDSLQSVEETEG